MVSDGHVSSGIPHNKYFDRARNILVQFQSPLQPLTPSSGRLSFISFFPVGTLSIHYPQHDRAFVSLYPGDQNFTLAISSILNSGDQHQNSSWFSWHHADKYQRLNRKEKTIYWNRYGSGREVVMCSNKPTIFV